MSSEAVAQNYLDDSRKAMRAYKKLAEKALDQLKDDEYFITLDEESNSVAVVMKHLAGNMFSRWTDFLTTDGEKPNRNRDYEFVIETANKEQLMDYWERGWKCFFNAVEPLKSEAFDKKVSIRGQEHTIVMAINRQLAHYAYHIGQLVFLAKHFRSSEWQSLSIPRNRSAAFNQYLEQGKGAGEGRMDQAMKFADEK